MIRRSFSTHFRPPAPLSKTMSTASPSLNTRLRIISAGQIPANHGAPSSNTRQQTNKTPTTAPLRSAAPVRSLTGTMIPRRKFSGALRGTITLPARAFKTVTNVALPQPSQVLIPGAAKIAR